MLEMLFRVPSVASSGMVTRRSTSSGDEASHGRVALASQPPDDSRLHDLLHDVLAERFTYEHANSPSALRELVDVAIDGVVTEVRLGPVIDDGDQIEQYYTLVVEGNGDGNYGASIA